MKNVTKTNVLFTATVLVYIILSYSLEFVPASLLTVNMLLVVPEIILLLPALAYVLVLRPKTVDGVSMSVVSPTTTILTVVLTFAIMPLVMFINSLTSLFAENSVDTVLTHIVNNNPLWLNLLIIALLPAVVEEFIFRGLIFNGYKRRNPFMAILLSAALFGLIHMNINQFSYAFAIFKPACNLPISSSFMVPSAFNAKPRITTAILSSSGNPSGTVSMFAKPSAFTSLQ